MLGVAARLHNHGRSMMPAHIEKRSQHAIRSAHSNDRLAGNVRGDEFAGRGDLRRAANRLPRASEHALAFEFGDARIGIPRRGNGVGFGERRLVVVHREDCLHGLFHENFPFGELTAGRAG